MEMPISGYSRIKNLSAHSEVCLCREDATGRLVVVKHYSKNTLVEFRKSVAALSELSDLLITPRLLFAISNEYISLYATDYFCGTILSESKNTLNQFDKIAINEKLEHGLAEIHQRGFSHGDITPNNLLIMKKQNRLFIRLIDWDFSDKCNDIGYDAYAVPRGTAGYSLDPTSSLRVFEKDIESLRNIRNYLNLESVSSKGEKTWASNRWLDRLFR